jgi:hypothetical protein
MKNEFMKPARAHERVEAVSTIKVIRPASMIFEQCLRLAGMPDKILCKAKQTCLRRFQFAAAGFTRSTHF